MCDYLTHEKDKHTQTVLQQFHNSVLHLVNCTLKLTYQIGNKPSLQLLLVPFSELEWFPSASFPTGKPLRSRDCDRKGRLTRGLDSVPQQHRTQEQPHHHYYVHSHRSPISPLRLGRSHPGARGQCLHWLRFCSCQDVILIGFWF